MKRRKALGKIALGAGLGASALATQVQASTHSKKFKWNLAMAVPKTLPIWAEGIQYFSELVKKMSQGQFEIRVYGAGELVNTTDIFDAVSQGTVHMGHAAAYYWQGKIPASVFFTSVPFGMNANGMTSWIQAGGGQQLWDELYKPYGVKALPLGNTGVQMGGWFKKEIRSVDDFKGLKMRMPGLGGKVIARAGAKPVMIPGGEIFQSLETGVIDATEWVGPYHDYLLGFPKIAPFYYTGGWHEPGSVLELSINLKAWNSLPPHLQSILSAAASEVSSLMFSHWLAKDSEYLEKIKKEGKVKLKEYPIELTREMKKISKDLLQRISKKDAITKKIYDSFTQFQIQYEAHQEISERAYVRAQKA